MQKLMIKTFIVISWIVVIFGLLLTPKWKALQPNDAKTLNIFTWGDYFDPKVLEQFEKDHGVKIQLHYYSSNEELILKLKAHKGQGYDLVVPSDYAVQILIKENLLQPLDYSRITFLDQISPALLHHPFDPHNRYSLPNMFEVYGIGFDPDQIDPSRVQPTFGHVFDPSMIDYAFAMTPDPVEAVTFAACYLYGKVDRLDSTQTARIRQLLIDQKPLVEAYADYRSKYLLQTKNCALSILRASFLLHIARENPQMSFMLPKEATVVSIESVAIPIGCEKTDLVYSFLNYLYQDEVMASQVAICPLFPATSSACAFLHEPDLYFSIYNQVMKKPNFYFFRHLIPEETAREIWVEVKN
jgi:spermidine/putrescine transport system substrate-binding protein